MGTFAGRTEQLQHSHTTQLRVRYGETDAMGYVYYGTYPLYFEVGRNELMRHLGFPYASLEASGIMMPVVDMQLHYGSPAHYDNLLSVTTGIVSLGGASIEFGYRIADEANTLVVWGTTTLAFVNRDTRKPVRVPQAVRDRLTL